MKPAWNINYIEACYNLFLFSSQAPRHFKVIFGWGKAQHKNKFLFTKSRFTASTPTSSSPSTQWHWSSLPTSSATNNPWPTSEPDKASCLHRSVNFPRDSALLSLSPGSTWSSSPPTDQRVGEQSLLHQDFYHPDTLSGRIVLCAWSSSSSSGARVTLQNSPKNSSPRL